MLLWIDVRTYFSWHSSVLISAYSSAFLYFQTRHDLEKDRRKLEQELQDLRNQLAEAKQKIQELEQALAKKEAELAAALKRFVLKSNESKRRLKILMDWL